MAKAQPQHSPILQVFTRKYTQKLSSASPREHQIKHARGGKGRCDVQSGLLKLSEDLIGIEGAFWDGWEGSRNHVLQPEIWCVYSLLLGELFAYFMPQSILIHSTALPAHITTRRVHLNHCMTSCFRTLYMKLFAPIPLNCTIPIRTTLLNKILSS